MINVDFASPALVLGTALIGCGVVLLQLRNLQRKISRDADIVVAAMISIVGSTLIFQGWRLDPLLLLCQALTTSVAFWYGLETFRLRSSLDAQQEKAESSAPPESYYPGPEQYRNGYLPPPQAPQMQEYPWGDSVQQGPPSSSQPYGAPTYYETIKYDYYGNPIEGPFEPPQDYDTVSRGAAPKGDGVNYYGNEYPSSSRAYPESYPTEGATTEYPGAPGYGAPASSRYGEEPPYVSGGQEGGVSSRGEVDRGRALPQEAVSQETTRRISRLAQVNEKVDDWE